MTARSVSGPQTGTQGRQARQLIRKAAAQLSGRSRGPDRKVRRNSFDINDPRARVFRRIADGTVAGGSSWADDLMQVAEEYNAWAPKEKGGRGPLTPYGLTVLRWMLQRLDFKSGRLDPPLAWLEKVTGFARRTICEALKRLRQHHFLFWVRRSRKTDRNSEAGPQREQETNAYFFDLTQLAKRALQRFRDLRERRRRRAANGAPSAPVSSSAREPVDPALSGLLDRIGSKLTGRES